MVARSAEELPSSLETVFLGETIRWEFATESPSGGRSPSRFRLLVPAGLFATGDSMAGAVMQSVPGPALEHSTLTDNRHGVCGRHARDHILPGGTPSSRKTRSSPMIHCSRKDPLLPEDPFFPDDPLFPEDPFFPDDPLFPEDPFDTSIVVADVDQFLAGAGIESLPEGARYLEEGESIETAQTVFAGSGPSFVNVEGSWVSRRTLSPAVDPRGWAVRQSA
ncbi:MAG: hypothetical protein U5K37_00565 [Natrialbaceae archaeon]|nr:hypothetical protein [Natrialbaceae archaeon]